MVDRNHHWQTLSPFLLPTFTRGKKLYAQEFLIARWLHFFILKADAQYPLNVFRTAIWLSLGKLWVIFEGTVSLT